ncbi:MAG: SMP-30/gluconolactonase/LRE family protein [bacterium]|nr:SMP-30/gluconolactonase/LRE family protein [bacterium]
MKKVLLSGLMLLMLFPNKGWSKDLVFSAEFPAAYHKYDFDKPSDVFIDTDGCMYVANTGKKCVQRFNPKGELEQEFYGESGNMLSQPIGVTVDTKRNVFVIDADLKCVLGFNRNGNVISVWGKGSIGKPCGMTVGVINGNDRVYVTDIDNHCVWEFDGKTLGIRKIGEEGTRSGQFLSPTDIAFNPANSMLYVVDTGNHCIQRIYAVVSSPEILYYKDKLEGLGTLTGITINGNQDIYITAKRKDRETAYESVYKFDANGTKKNEWGGKAGFGAGQFGDIAGLFAKNELVYVVDRGNNCIQRFNNNTGMFVDLLSKYSFEKGKFNSPVDMSFDSNGNMFVVDKNNHRIQKFDKNGNVITAWGGKSSAIELGKFDSPAGIAIDKGNSDKVFVVDSYNNRIQRFYNTGVNIDYFGKLGGKNSEFANPQDIAIDSTGNIFVVDAANKRIQVFDRDKKFVTQWAVGNSPLDIEVIEAGGVEEIYVVCHSAHDIKVYNKTGSLIRTIGGEGREPDAGDFRYPCGIARDSFMRLYVLDRGNECLHIMDRYGKTLGIWKWQTGMDSGQISPLSKGGPEGIAIDNNDNIYIADTGNHRIQRFKPFDFVPCGGIIGTVTNHGTPVHNARVEIRHPETGKTVHTVWTDSYGRYAVNEVSIGTYSVVVIKDGYGTGYVMQAVSIKANDVSMVEEVVLVPMISAEIDLHNYPNPFNPIDGDMAGSATTNTLTDGTIIYYNLKDVVKQLYLEIYNLAGELIWEYDAKDADCNSGGHHVPWHGRSRDGNIVADGVYFCVLTAGDRVETCKIAVKK